MADSRLLRHAYCWLAGALLIVAAPVAFAGLGLVASSRVSGNDSVANVEVRFNCKVEYLRHEPPGRGDNLRIYLDPTTVCNGVSPLVAESQGRYRPANADSARLVDLEYDGTSAAGPVLTLNFSEPVRYALEASTASFELIVRIYPATAQATTPAARPTTVRRQVVRPKQATPDFVINLLSLRRVPTVADVPRLRLAAGQRIYYTEANLDGTTWYRVRLGNFKSAGDAKNALAGLKMDHPGAWIGQVDANAVDTVLAVTAQAMPTDQSSPAENGEVITETAASLPSGLATGGSKVDLLMEQARISMVAGDTSKAVQIYTKILQLPEHARQPEAQEYLALAREKRGQTAHAKAEYQRYLSLYPDHDGAARVRQRLAALLATKRITDGPVGTSVNSADARTSRQSDWRVQTFFSQYYRRDANQQNDEKQIVSQSALYSDINFDARRRGDRFDFVSRVSAGYRKELLTEEQGSGDLLRVSYAYADLADAVTGLRGRIGRQSRHTGGVLGRFDGLNIGYQLNERVWLDTVVGKPVYSTSNKDAPSRSFYGASINYGPVLENLELGLFYIEQEIEGIQDRQAVGGDFRYFGASQSIWGMVDYDISYDELASAFLQGSWRFPSRFSIHALADRRSSPFLSTGNAMIGQPLVSFAQLIEIYGEDELRQFSQDRTSMSATYTLGFSYPLTPKLQINVDASQSTMEETPASGGVLATPATRYNYYSGNLIVSSLLREGDVSIVSARFSESDTSKVISMSLDSRYPIGSNWRINPRLRVDRRQNLTNSTYEWLYSPGLRIHYRRSRKLRIELEIGKQFAQRETATADLDRESYFINFGYQAFF